MLKLSDSPTQEIQLPGINNSRPITVTVDMSTGLKELAKSKSSPVGKEFKSETSFFAITPTVLNLLLRADNKSLETRIVEDCESSQKVLMSKVKAELEVSGETVSQAFYSIQPEEDYQIGQRYRVQVTLWYR